MSTPGNIQTVRLNKFLNIAICVLAFFYLVNSASPLRLHVDMLRYYAIKDCIELGCPPDSEAALDYLPYGYTGLILILSKLHILTSFTIVLINCLYLLGTVLFLKKIFGDNAKAVVLTILLLLNWTTIKFVLHPLSELQYTFFSIGAVYYFNKFSSAKQFLNLLFAAIFAIIAFMTRTVGIALAGALVLSLLWHYRMELSALIKKNKLLFTIILLVIAGIGIFSRELGLNHYTGVMNKQFVEGMTFRQILSAHFTEWSEIFFNSSIVKVNTILPPGIAPGLFLVTGILLVLAFTYILLRKQTDIPVIMRTYLILYSLLMFSWPFYDPRFWVPVLPLIIYTIIQAYSGTNRILKAGFVTYLVAYTIMGVASIGYMTYTSFNKEVFAKTQAAGAYKNEYEIHFFGRPLSDTVTTVNKATISVLERYD